MVLMDLLNLLGNTWFLLLAMDCVYYLVTVMGFSSCNLDMIQKLAALV
jgi:hypothetical protein